MATNWSILDDAIGDLEDEMSTGRVQNTWGLKSPLVRRYVLGASSRLSQDLDQPLRLIGCSV